MARNYEKNFGQLNRLWLSRENASYKRTRRPRLAELNTVEDIQKWLPSIKEEIEFCLTQSQVPCYTNGKVREYHEKVVKLEIEYKRFLKKAKSFDSRVVFTASMHKPYERRRKDKACNIPMPKIIPLPVLDEPENQTDTMLPSQSFDSICQNSDLPLQFECKPLLVGKTTKEKPAHQLLVKSNPLGLCYSSSDDET